MNLLGLALFAGGYTLAYYAVNILVDAYSRTATMNPPPLWILFGIPGQTGNGSGGQGAARSAQ
jgi:hypothetical protein